jgi:GTP-binding protein EngB required for normal cell division
MSNEHVEVNAIDPVRRQQLIEEAKRRALEAKDKRVILFVGPTGSGKSTTFNAMINRPMEVVELNDDDQPRYQVVADQAVAESGDGKKSKTLFPQVVEANNLVLVDCAGFGENRKEEEKHTANIGLREVIKHAKSVRGVVVIFEYGSLKVERRESLTRLISMLSQLIKEPGKLSAEEKSAITFIITKVPNGMNRIRLKNLIQNIKTEVSNDKSTESNKELELMNLMQESNLLTIRTDGTGFAPDTNELLDLEGNRQYIINYLSKLPEEGLKAENFILTRPESVVAHEADYFEARTNLIILSNIKESTLCNQIIFKNGSKPSDEQKRFQSLHQALRALQDNLFLIMRNRLAMVNKEPDVNLENERLEQNFDQLMKLFEKSLPFISSDTYQQLINTTLYLSQFQRLIGVLFKEDKLGDDITLMINKLTHLETVLHNQLTRVGTNEIRQRKKSASVALDHVHKLVEQSQERLKELEQSKTEMLQSDQEKEQRLVNDIPPKQATADRIANETCPVVTASAPVGSVPALLAQPPVPSSADPGAPPTSYSFLEAYHKSQPIFMPHLVSMGGVPIGTCHTLPSLDVCRELLTIRHTFDHSCGALHDQNEQRKLDNLLNEWENKYKINWRLVFDLIYKADYKLFGEWCGRGGLDWYSHNGQPGYHDKKAAYDESVRVRNAWVTNKNNFDTQTAALNEYNSRKTNAANALQAAKVALTNHRADATERLREKNGKIADEKAVLARVKYVRLLMIGFTKALNTFIDSPHSENVQDTLSNFIALIQSNLGSLPDKFQQELQASLNKIRKEKKGFDKIFAVLNTLQDKSLALVFDKSISFDEQLTKVNKNLQSIKLNYDCTSIEFISLCQEIYGSASLTKLDLSSAKINNEKLNELFAVLRVSPQLRVLNLSNNELDDNAAMSLLALIYSHPGLCEIHLERNPAISPTVLELVRGALLLRHRLRGETPEKITEKLDQYMANYLHAVELLSLKQNDKRKFTAKSDAGGYEATHDSKSEKLRFSDYLDRAKKVRNALKLSNDLKSETPRETKAFFMSSRSASQRAQTGAYQANVGRTFWSGSSAASQSSSAQSSVETQDQHWYTHREVFTALSQQVQRHRDLMVLTPLSSTQLNGASLRDNLHDVLRIRLNPEVNAGVAYKRLEIPLNLGGNASNSGAGEDGSHWVMLYLDLRNTRAPVVRYADPLGTAISQDLRDAVSRVLNERQFGPAIFESSRVKHLIDGYNRGPWIVEIGQYLADHEGQLPKQNFIADINARRAAQQEMLRVDPDYQAQQGNPRQGNGRP